MNWWTPKVAAFFPQSKFGTEKSEREWNPIPYPEYEYLSGSVFLVNLAAPKKQYFKAN